MPQLSIIIPVYNVEKYLDDCIESILRQSFNDWELILIDDGSSDSSPEICDRWNAEDDRIQVIHIENTGPAHARNVGLDNCSGDFLMFMDSDDVLLGDETLLNLISIIKENEAIDMVQFPLLFFNENLEPKPSNLVFPDKILDNKKDFFENLFLHDINPNPFLMAGPVTKIFRMKHLSHHRFPEDMTIGEDAYLSLELLDEEINNIRVVNVGGYAYRQHSASIMHRVHSLKYYQNLIKAYLKFGEMLKKYSNEPRRLWRLYSYLESLNYTIMIRYGKQHLNPEHLRKTTKILPFGGSKMSFNMKWLLLHSFGMMTVLHLIRIKSVLRTHLKLN